MWCLPVIPNNWSEVEIQEQEITTRVTDLPRGIVPLACQHLTAAIDLGKYLNHWVLVAWTDGPFAHVVNYGRIEVAESQAGISFPRSAVAHRSSTNSTPTTGSTTVHVGESFHINWLPEAKCHLLELNSDHWKTWVQQRLKTPLKIPGAMSLFQASTAEHTAFAKQKLRKEFANLSHNFCQFCLSC